MSALTAHVVVRRRQFDVEAVLRVAEGETLAIMGPSGAGKSTVLAALAGLAPLDDGEIRVGATIVDRAARPRVRVAPMRRGIVLLAQDPGLFPHLSARENVAFGPRAAGVSPARARADADAWLERVGLPGAGDRRPGQLSGGEQQRVAVARALAAGPRVVLLDEPLVALDPETAAEIRGMLRARLAGVTTVAVTHDAADAVALADRLVVLERGRVSAEGPVRDVLAAPATRFIASVAGLERLVGRRTGDGWEGDGLRLVLGRDAAGDRLDAGSAAAIVFRPADVRVGGAERLDPRACAWTGRILALEPTLTGMRVRTDRGSAEIEQAAAAGLAVGDEVGLAIDPARLRIVPA